MRLRMLLLAMLVVALAVGALLVRNDLLTASSLSPAEILHRSFAAMASIRSVHAVGDERDTRIEPDGGSSVASLRFQGDCTQQRTGILSRLSDQGLQSGGRPGSFDDEYIMHAARYEGNPSRWSRSVEIWVRSIRSPGTWNRTRAMLNTRIVVPMCPLLNVPPLHWSVPGSLKDLGPVRTDGRSTVHVQVSDEGVAVGEFADLYIDPSSFRWIRIVLHGFGPPGFSYRSEYDYSRYNAFVRISVP